MPMYRVRTIFTGSPVSDGLTTVHFDAGASTPGAAQFAFANFLGTISTHFYQFQTMVVSGEVDLINEVTGALVDTATVGDIAIDTTNAAAALPPSTQLLLRLTTAAVVDGRRLKGRIFLPAFTEDDNAGEGAPVASMATAVGTALETLIDDTGTDLQVWHRPRPGSPGSMADVVSGSVGSQWSVLRKRRPGY